MIEIKVNEHITKFSEIKAHLDSAMESLHCTEITILNDGCSNAIITKIVKYVKDHDVVCIVESKGASALNRLYGGK